MEYTYVVLRYVHDNAAGESLNFGVLLVAPEVNFVGCRFDPTVRRLTGTFRGFNTDLHRQMIQELKGHSERWNRQYQREQQLLFPLSNAERQVREMWPDRGLNYQATEARAGTGDDPQQALDALFNRFVTRQAPDRKPRNRRDDADIWKEIHTSLSSGVASKLHPSEVDTGFFAFKFEHTYRNGLLHVVEPLSFDLLEADSIRDKSLRWMGYAQHLIQHIGSLRLVVSGPNQLSAKNAYDNAIKMLSTVTEVYELHQARRLEHDLENLMN